MPTLTSRTWWLAALLRAGRTVLVALLPFLPAIPEADRTTVLVAVLTIALAAVLSLATSLASLPELDDVARPWWTAALDRFARTFGQVLLAGLASAALITDVDWRTLLLHALAAALGSVVLAVIAKLPEAEPVTVPADRVVVQLNRADELAVGDASPFVTGTVIDPSMPVGDIAPGPRHLA